MHVAHGREGGVAAVNEHADLAGGLGGRELAIAVLEKGVEEVSEWLLRYLSPAEAWLTRIVTNAKGAILSWTIFSRSIRAPSSHLGTMLEGL